MFVDVRQILPEEYQSKLSSFASVYPKHLRKSAPSADEHQLIGLAQAHQFHTAGCFTISFFHPLDDAIGVG